MNELTNILEDVKKKIPMSSGDKFGYNMMKDPEATIEKMKLINFDISLSIIDLALILEAINERGKDQGYEFIDYLSAIDEIENKVLKIVGQKNYDIIGKVANKIRP